MRSSGCNVRSMENILGQSRVMQEVVISVMASEFDNFASNLDSVVGGCICVTIRFRNPFLKLAFK